MPPLLKETTLCAIVRDEKENPQGGVRRFLDTSLPFVEAAIIADTGSKDGTREILERAKSDYPHLEVFDTPFVDYATARNAGIDRAKTKYILVLDADERILEKDYVRINSFIAQNPRRGYSFNIVGISPDQVGESETFLRLFEYAPDIRFTDGYFESVVVKTPFGEKSLSERRGWHLNTRIRIYHFDPPKEAVEAKLKEWYEFVSEGGDLISHSPSDFPSFRKWKAYNPKERLYQ